MKPGSSKYDLTAIRTYIKKHSNLTNEQISRNTDTPRWLISRQRNQMGLPAVKKLKTSPLPKTNTESMAGDLSLLWLRKSITGDTHAENDQHR